MSAGVRDLVSLADLATRISEDMAQLATFFGDSPDPDALPGIMEHAAVIEKACNLKASFDAAVAYMVETAEPALLVGTSKPVNYLMQQLDLSYREAITRIERGRAYYAPIVVDRTADDPADPSTMPDVEALTKHRDHARALAKEQCLSAEVQNCINRTLEDLLPGTTPSKQELYAQAVQEAATRNYRDLGQWLRKQIRYANSRVAPDPLAATNKRGLSIGDQDSIGGHTLRGYISAAGQAILETAVAPYMRNPALLGIDPDTDDRSFPQRRLDAVMHILENHVVHGNDNRQQGPGSLVISMTADELAEGKPDTFFPTNTGTLLNPVEALALCGARYDFLAIHNLDSPKDISLIQTGRLASVWHKLALFTQELVCSHPGCDEPTIFCDQHHLDAWSHGGITELANLTLLCRRHHVDNDDSKTRRNRGHAKRSTASGRRVGYIAPGRRGGEPAVNTSCLQEESAAEKLRRCRAHERSDHEKTADDP